MLFVDMEIPSMLDLCMGDFSLSKIIRPQILISFYSEAFSHFLLHFFTRNIITVKFFFAKTLGQLYRSHAVGRFFYNCGKKQNNFD